MVETGTGVEPNHDIIGAMLLGGRLRVELHDGSRRRSSGRRARSGRRVWARSAKLQGKHGMQLNKIRRMTRLTVRKIKKQDAGYCHFCVDSAHGWLRCAKAGFDSRSHAVEFRGPPVAGNALTNTIWYFGDHRDIRWSAEV